jgi:TatD-related deoxyribonuclease
MARADEVLLEVLGLCKQANVPAQLHLDGNGEATNREIAKICDRVRFPRFGAIHHHAEGNVSKQFTHGLTSSVVVGRESIKDISDSIWKNEGGFLMETDYMDDPRRPGAVLGPKTVPRRTQALATSLIGKGIDAETALCAVHIDLPEALYGEYE